MLPFCVFSCVCCPFVILRVVGSPFIFSEIFLFTDANRRACRGAEWRRRRILSVNSGRRVVFIAAGRVSNIIVRVRAFVRRH